VLYKAKKESWPIYCESIDNVKDTARINKILLKEYKSPSLLSKADGNSIRSIRETLEILVDTHFPGNNKTEIET